jgi:hypothetical protein
VKSRFLPNRAGDRRFLVLEKWVLLQEPLLGGIMMPTKNDFAQNHSLPSTLSECTVRPKRLPFVATRQDTTIRSSLAGILIGALLGIATAIGTLSVWDPVIFAEIKSSLPEIPALQIVFDQSKPATQSKGTPESLLQTRANEAPPARDDIAKAPEPAKQTQADAHQPSNEDLFRQFQAWAAEAEKRAKVEPVVQLVEEAPPKLEIMKPQQQDVSRVRNTRAEVRSKKRRQVQHGRMLFQPAGT